jgi:tetratricopeptide (TPR) repeat protein
VNPDRLAELEEERRFLLRSLRDLDAELGAGDVDRLDYETLRDGYTKRAADVLREIEEGRAALAPRRPRRWARSAAIAVAVLVVAVGAGIVAARSSGERTVGDEMTGGIPGRQDTATLLAEARRLLGGDPRRAQDAYQRVLDRDPENPEALTYQGWLLYFASAGASPEVRDAAVATAQQRLAAAVAADPTYPDPHCFLAVIAADAQADTATARDEAEQCLALDPPAQVRALVDDFTERLEPTG